VQKVISLQVWQQLFSQIQLSYLKLLLMLVLLKQVQLEVRQQVLLFA